MLRWSLLLLGVLPLLAGSAAEPLVRREWMVDGVPREALVAAPSAATNSLAPLVFAFHGPGGSMFVRFLKEHMKP